MPDPVKQLPFGLQSIPAIWKNLRGFRRCRVSMVALSTRKSVFGTLAWSSWGGRGATPFTTARRDPAPNRPMRAASMASRGQPQGVAKK